MVVRTIPSALWEQVPAIVVPYAPAPLLLINKLPAPGARLSPASPPVYRAPARSTGDDRRDPSALASHHFRETSDDIRYLWQSSRNLRHRPCISRRRVRSAPVRRPTRARTFSRCGRRNSPRWPPMSVASPPSGFRRRSGHANSDDFLVPVEHGGRASGRTAAGVIVRESLSTVVARARIATAHGWQRWRVGRLRRSGGSSSSTLPGRSKRRSAARAAGT